MQKVNVWIVKPENLEYDSKKNYSLNPGLGGTEFLTLRLYAELKKENDLEVFLITNSELLSLIEQKYFSQTGKFDRVISARAYLSGFNPKSFGEKLIVWSHHPYDNLHDFRHNRIISLSEFQYLSNIRYGCQRCIIPNYFTNPNFELKCFSDFNSERIIFMGALIPTKGISQVLSLWSRSKIFLEFSLDVIGSGDLYDPSRPANSLNRKELNGSVDNAFFARKFRKKMEMNISNDLTLGGRVNYLGKLNEERFSVFESTFCAVFNPEGRSEAFPATILEFLSYGIPVITTSQYGNSEFMRFFPEIVCNNAEEIPNKIRELKQSPHLYQALSDRCFKVSQFYASRNVEITYLWKSLLIGEEMPTTFHRRMVDISFRKNIFYKLKNFFK